MRRSNRGFMDRVRASRLASRHVNVTIRLTARSWGRNATISCYIATMPRNTHRQTKDKACFSKENTNTWCKVRIQTIINSRTDLIGGVRSSLSCQAYVVQNSWIVSFKCINNNCLIGTQAVGAGEYFRSSTHRARATWRGYIKFTAHGRQSKLWEIMLTFLELVRGIRFRDFSYIYWKKS